MNIELLDKANNLLAEINEIGELFVMHAYVGNDDVTNLFDYSLLDALKDTMGENPQYGWFAEYKPNYTEQQKPLCSLDEFIKHELLEMAKSKYEEFLEL